MDRSTLLKEGAEEISPGASLSTLIIINYFVKIHNIRPVLFTLKSTVFAPVICALFFILAVEKSGCVKYQDLFSGGVDLGFILV